MKREKIVWLISDGKRGHENQSRGLLRALSAYAETQEVLIDTQNTKASWFDYLNAKLPVQLRALPQPNLIIATGSQTHSTLLAAGRATKAPTLVIMAPPRGLCHLFDRCIIPQHDGRKGKNIIQTIGAMNLVRPAAKKTAASGLFLIGGPSKHHKWNEGGLVQQIQQILACEPQTHWTLTTSRRTPKSTTQLLQSMSMAGSQLQVTPASATGADWLPTQLAKTEKSWVTEDSVSMVYEALSGGAKVGLLPVPRKSKDSRIIRGLDNLVQTKYVLTYDPLKPELSQFKPVNILAEAERVAALIARDYFEGAVELRSGCT